MPIQLTLTSVVTIGIPSFILALEPNKERIKGNFFFNVIKEAVPYSLTIVFNILIIMILSSILNFNFEQSSTLCVILTGFTGFTLLYHLCKPFDLIRFTLLITMISLFIFQIIKFKTWYSLSILTSKMIIVMLILMILAYFIVLVLKNVVAKIIDKKGKEDI